MKHLDKILQSKKTIFSYKDLEIILGIENKNTLKKVFERAVKENIFQNIQKGIYALQEYDSFELGTKLKKNSYISFETVLKKEGIIFQDYGNNIFLASDNSLTKKIKHKSYQYLKLKNSILQNPLGLKNMGNYTIATKERAICDRVYLSKNYYFDTLGGVDFEKLEEISKIYNKRTILEIKKLIKDAR